MAIGLGDIVGVGFVGPRHPFHHGAVDAWPMVAAHEEERSENEDPARDRAGDQKFGTSHRAAAGVLITLDSVL
jgi:hypothetical protein